MPNTEVDVLKECFCLVEDPFDPKADPRKNFSFSEKKASLTRALDIFNIGELESYFIKIGKFDEAVKEVASFMNRSGYRVASNSPPTFLIEAPTGAGRSSLASYIAYQVKQYIGGSSNLETVSVPSEDEAKLAYFIKKLLELHIKRHSLSACEPILTTYPDSQIWVPPNGPDMFSLATLFQQLSHCMIDAPPLLLIIEEITYERMGWMFNLHKMLAPLNIVLIFLTNDVRVRKQFEKLIKNADMTGCCVSLEKLDEASAMNFLTRRLDSFRKEKCDETKKNLFPFDPKVFPQAFKGEPGSRLGGLESVAGRLIGVKMLLTLFRGAFYQKLAELNQLVIANAAQQPPPQLKPEDLLITWRYFDDGYRNEIRTVAARDN